ncbi:uncharacterized protein LOC130939271 [Arachis stenosperma]|uniref:uncharacterized protein LOC130939271 n=1 Tax=Arachis stenosperma TaxID=217475 RepID=UPI0025ABD84B|nr:uncharacterized protein LOC130939271 [Arachis stenosperma]
MVGHFESLMVFLPDLDIIDGLDDRIIADELTFDIVALRDELEVMLSEMNCEQQNAFHRISEAVNNNLGGFFFIYGYGGTGKTFLYRALSAAIRVKGEIVLNVASSGIASLLLPKGRTAHSRFKIPLELHEDSVCSIKQGSPLAKLICKAKLIIWDEAPMLNKICYEALDKSLKDILRSSSSYNEDLPFGGKVVVLGGDFRQILPVIPMGSRQDIVQATINSSYLWSSCKSELDTFTPDVLNAINCSGLPPHELILKVGVPVMLLRNIDQFNGLCNGTRLQVRRLGNHVIECVILTGDKAGDVVLIPRMNMIPNNPTLPFRFQRRQFPLVVSFAMTINKSQGQTLSTVGLYLPKPVFTHGQLYVALSRVKSKLGLRVLIQNNTCISTSTTINVVYREVFQNIS